MLSRHDRGSTVRVYLDIADAGVPATGEVPTCAIQRLTDGFWFKGTTGLWQSAIFDNSMVETSVSNLPGRYHFVFDQSLDLDTSSRSYVARKTNASIGAPRLEYEDLVFGPVAASAPPELCVVTGSIYGLDGLPAGGELVRATLYPVLKDSTGRGIKSARVALAYTNDAGDFSISLVRGGTFRLEVGAIGYDRKVLIPDETTVLFTDL